MRQAILDSFEDNYVGEMNQHTFPFIDRTNEGEVLDWLKKDMEGKFRSRQDRLMAIKRLDAMFKGLPYQVDAGAFRDGDEDAGIRRPKSIYNFMVEMVEAKISQRARFKPAITVIPEQTDLPDENRAEASKLLLTTKAQEIDLDMLISAGDKVNFLSGESYTYIPWNKNLGGIDKAFSMALAQGLTPQYDDGTPMQAVYAGDIDVQVLGPDRCYHQLGKKRWQDVEDIDIIEWIAADELKADFPDKAGDIHPADMFSQYIDSEERRQHEHDCLVFTYYHKPTRFLPKGIRIKFTEGVILEMIDYPYLDHKGQPLQQLPVVFDTDIDVQGEITGRPFTANIEKMQRLHDMLSASMARGYAIANSPKWMYQKGTVDPNKLANNFSSLEFKGPIPPQLVAFNGVPTATLDLLTWTEKGIEKGSSVYGISRGEPPKGIKAAVALQFLDEQEMQRESRGMAKRQRRIIEIYKMMLSRMQQYYKAEDGRIFRYLGEDNQYLVVDFSTMDITGNFDIRIENSSALPDSKTGKIAAILDLNTATQADPMFSKEAIAQMLELGNDRRFKNQSTSALKAAQYKLQLILNGQPAPEPRPWDDFIVEYPLFIQTLRQREFKGEDPTVMAGLEMYVKGMEYEMWKKAQMNPMFKQKVMMFAEYPVFFQVPIMMPNQAAQPAPTEGAVGPMDSQTNEMNEQKQVINEQGAN